MIARGDWEEIVHGQAKLRREIEEAEELVTHDCRWNIAAAQALVKSLW